MHSIWKREIEFEDFIRDMVSTIKYPPVTLYANLVLVESYFEFITRILLGQFELSDEEEDKWKQCVAIDKLASKKLKIIDQNDKELFHAVRKLRNKVVHNIRFEPDLQRLQEFVKTCFNEKLDPLEEYRSSSSQEELEEIFCSKIVNAFALISNKYKQQVDQKIANYLKTVS